jgi:4-amino-4-deoxy-L-arabinose transferase-like glycosyltransferase
MKPAKIAVWVVVVLLCLAGAGRGLWTPDEPREAEMGREMYLDPGLVPTLNDELFYQKPPLYYWAVASAFALSGGPSVDGARMVSSLAAIFTLIITFVWARRAHGTTTAWIATVMLATSGQFFVGAQWIRIDGLLMLWCTLAFWSGWELINGKSGWKYLTIFYAANILSFWTKGMIGPVLVMVGLGLLFVVDFRNKPWRSIRPVLGIFLFGLAFSVLVALMYLESGSQIVWGWFWENHVQRLIEPKGTGHKQPFYYYIYNLPLALLPWLLPLALTLRPAFWKEQAGTAIKRYAGAMCAAGALLLSIASTKRGVYLLPLMPVFCLLMGLAVEHLFRTFSTPSSTASATPPGWPLRAGIWLQALFCAMLGVAPAIAHIIYSGSVTMAAVLCGIAGAAAGAGTIRYLRQGDLPRSAGWAVGSTVMAFLAITIIANPILSEAKEFDSFLNWVDDQLEPGETIDSIGADETLRGIVPFLTQRKLACMDKHDPFRSQDVRGGPPRYLLVQIIDKFRNRKILEDRYREIRTQQVGSRRSIGLWERKFLVPASSAETDSSETSSKRKARNAARIRLPESAVHLSACFAKKL